MKKTFITLLALAGVASAEVAGYTDTYTASDWENGAITLNNTLDLSLDYWSISATITLLGSTDSATWGTRVFYSSSEEKPGVNNFFLWHGHSSNQANIDRNIIKFRGFGFQESGYDHRVQATTGGELLYTAGTYTFNYTRDGEALTLSVYNDSMQLLGSTVIDTPAGMDGKITTLKSDINSSLVQSGYSMPMVTITTTKPIPEPATATLSLLALAGLCARRRRA